MRDIRPATSTRLPSPKTKHGAYTTRISVSLWKCELVPPHITITSTTTKPTPGGAGRDSAQNVRVWGWFSGGTAVRGFRRGCGAKVGTAVTGVLRGEGRVNRFSAGYMKNLLDSKIPQNCLMWRGLFVGRRFIRPFRHPCRQIRRSNPLGVEVRDRVVVLRVADWGLIRVDRRVFRQVECCRVGSYRGNRRNRRIATDPTGIPGTSGTKQE